MKKYNSLKYNVAYKFLLVILIFSLLLLIFIPLGLKNVFLEVSYQTIENSQKDLYIDSYKFSKINPLAVNHMLGKEQENSYVLLSQFMLEDRFISEVVGNLNTQNVETKRYEYKDSNQAIYYVIKKDFNGYSLISFVYGTYVYYYIYTLYKQLILIILIVVVITLIIAAFFSKSITNPLISISKKIKSISKNNWDDEIVVTRKDEIGEIQYALEEMRQHLKSQNRIQREMFQNISHDLKTPIMIIEGYSQSVIDGYVESEQLNEVAESIMEEAKRLEKKVKALLYINKIEQLTLEKKPHNKVDVNKLFNTVIFPFKIKFSNINFIIEITSEEKLIGEFEEWRVAIENIVDNMTRFAYSEIKLTYNSNEISIFNDGEHIEEKTLDILFEPYGVGNKSNFGLGLAITKKIVKMFGYDISAENMDIGVKFTIKK